MVVLVWGIVAHIKVIFQNYSEYKTRVIDAFTVSLGPGTDDPTIKNVNLKKKIDLKNARECPKFLENQFLQKKILKKKYDEFIAQNLTQTSLE